MNGTILALARRPGKHEPMESSEQFTLDVERGVIEDYGTSKQRQITILAQESWQAVLNDLGTEHAWTTRRANVLIEGIDLTATVGRQIHLGECRVRILGETIPCSLMDQLVPGLQAALVPDFRGGVYGTVEQAGLIRPGDVVSVAPSSTKNRDDQAANGGNLSM